MFGNFWGTVAGKMTDRWADIVAPALLFWAGGVLAWVFHGSGWSAFTGSGWSRLSDEITTRPNGQSVAVAAKLGVVLGALLIATISVIVVERLTLPVLRLLEGYWPSWLRGLTERRRRAAEKRKRADDDAWQQMQNRTEKQLESPTQNAEPTAEERLRMAGLEHRRRHRPILDEELLPTRVGNILRASETRPDHRYGLGAVVIWPRLWLVLPDLAREELTTARGSLDESVAAVIWGLGFMAFTPLAWWAAPAGILAAAIAVKWWVPARAEVFADLVEGAYDLYRSALYQQLRWPLPANPAEEQHTGQELTRYLVRGSDKPKPEFTSPPT
jgi:hypothetical protein